MKTQTVNYFDGTQKLQGTLFYDDSKQTPQPAVLLYHAFEGAGSFTLDYGKRIAQQGYTVFVADMYGDGQTSMTIEGCFALITPFLQDRALVRRRAVLAFETLLQQPNIDPTKIGALGFCFGGMCVLELARSGAALHSGITCHGVFAKSDLPTHPIKASLLLLHGYEDPQVPPTTLAPLAEELNAAGVKDWMFVFFGHGKHSFTDPKTGTFHAEKEKDMGREYNETIANRAYDYLSAFLKEQLHG
jgi:dienelactone hydrolase